MKSYLVTLYYPKDKYHSFNELLDNVMNDDVFFISEDDNGRVLSENIIKDFDSDSYFKTEFYLYTSDLFIPMNIKEYLSSKNVHYILKDQYGRVIYNTMVHNFYDLNSKRVNPNVYDLYSYGNIKMYFDKFNLVLYIINNRDFYDYDDFQLMQSAFNVFNRKTGNMYRIIDTNLSLDHRIIKFELQERMLHKLLKTKKHQ